MNTGAFTLLGNSSQVLAGMAVDNGLLYGISYDNSSGDLFTINPANGTLTSVGPSDVSYIDFGSTTSGLYALGFDGNHTRAPHSYRTACHVHFLWLAAKLTAKERHCGSYIRRGASAPSACAGRMPTLPERSPRRGMS